MKKGKMAKKERKVKREEYLAWWAGLTDEEKTKHIKENKERHAKIFQEKKDKQAAKENRIKKGIAKLQEADAMVFTCECPLYLVQTPARRDEKTGRILRPAVLEPQEDYFGVALAVRAIEATSGKNMQRLHVAYTIRSLKDHENSRVAKMHLGERMERGSAFSFEFNATVSPLDSKSIDHLIMLCWAEFSSEVRRPDLALPPRFVRSWLTNGIRDGLDFPAWQ